MCCTAVILFMLRSISFIEIIIMHDSVHATVMFSVFMFIQALAVIDSITYVTVAVTEVEVDTEEETRTTVLHRMTDGAVRGAGMRWRTTTAMSVEGPAAGGGDPAVVGRNGPGVTVVGVG